MTPRGAGLVSPMPSRLRLDPARRVAEREVVERLGGLEVALAEWAHDMPVAPLIDARFVEHVEAGKEAQLGSLNIRPGVAVRGRGEERRGGGVHTRVSQRAFFAGKKNEGKTSKARSAEAALARHHNPFRSDRGHHTVRVMAHTKGMLQRNVVERACKSSNANGSKKKTATGPRQHFTLQNCLISFGEAWPSDYRAQSAAAAEAAAGYTTATVVWATTLPTK